MHRHYNRYGSENQFALMHCATYWLMLTFMLCIIEALAHGAINVTAYLNKNRCAEDENIIWTITIITDDSVAVSEPKLPTLDDFVLVSQSYNSRTELVNMRVRMVMHFQYTLRPLRTGTLTIPPATIRVGNRTYATKPLTVHVVHSAGKWKLIPSMRQPQRRPSQPSFESMAKRIFVKASVNRMIAFVGEQIIYTFALCMSPYATVIDNPRYTPPRTPGFLQYALAEVPSHRVKINGQFFEVTEVRAALFPMKVGRLSIGSATIDVPISVTRPPLRLVTKPISITVKPLPATNRPADFTGAVGQYQMSASMSAVITEVGKPVQLKVTVRGNGDLALAKAPTIEDGSGLEIRLARMDTQRKASSEGLYSKCTFEYSIKPLKAGRYAIPPVRFCYFDPQHQQYRTLITKPQKLFVRCNARDSIIGGVKSPSISKRTDASSPHRSLNLKPLKTDVSPAWYSPAELQRNKVWWLVHALAILILLSSVAWWQWQKRLQQMSDSLEANAIIRTQLQNARRALKAGEPDDAYTHLARALRATVGVITNAHQSEQVSKSVIGGKLPAQLERIATLQQIAHEANQLLLQCERMRFATTDKDGGQAWEMLKNANRIWRSVRRVLNCRR